jgi:adenylyl- and sulfurtransferase ThiI
LPFGTDRGFSIGNIKASRKYKYTPSYKAIVFGIKARRASKQTKFSGLEVRPIVGGKIFG